MRPTLFEKTTNLMLNKVTVNFFYIFFFLSLILIFIAIYFHPYVGDDYYFIQSVSENSNFTKYFSYWYFN